MIAKEMGEQEPARRLRATPVCKVLHGLGENATVAKAYSYLPCSSSSISLFLLLAVTSLATNLATTAASKTAPGIPSFGSEASTIAMIVKIPQALAPTTNNQ